MTASTTATIERTAPAPAPTIATDQRVLIGVLAAICWVLILFLGRIWGIDLEREGHHLVLYTPPVLGGYRAEIPTGVWVVGALAIPFVLVLPALARRWRWHGTLVLAAVSALGWWVALALVDGTAGLTDGMGDGLGWDRDYGSVLPMVAAHPRTWLSNFTGGVMNDGVQVRAHPPGLELLLGFMHGRHLQGPGWAAAAVLATAAIGIVSVLVTVREVAGEDVARRALPFVVLSPAAIWIATSFDALYMGVAAMFVAALVVASGREGRRADTLAVVAGVLAAASIMLSYGLVLMGAVALPVIVKRRAWRAASIAAITAVVSIASLVPLGYWWLSGLGATRDAYYALGMDRPYAYFFVNNWSALALVVGPATAVALAWLRDRQVWLLVGGAVAAMVIANLSGLSTGEVERIWLPFAVWLLPAGASLWTRPLAVRAWLALQAGAALVFTALIRPVW